MFTKLKPSVIEHDKIVILCDDGTADIATIYDQDDERLFAESAKQDYSIPSAEVKAHVGPSGRIYTLIADSDYISDTKRLAALEKSIVLRQMTHFTKPPAAVAAGINIKAILMYVMIAVLLLAVIFK